MAARRTHRTDAARLGRGRLALAVLVGVLGAAPAHAQPRPGGNDYTFTCGSSAAALTAAIATSVLVTNPAANTANVKVGLDNTPALTLAPGDVWEAEVENANLVYCQRVGGADVTVEVEITQ